MILFFWTPHINRMLNVGPTKEIIAENSRDSLHFQQPKQPDKYLAKATYQ